MTKYAENTSVSSDQSRAEIERTLRRYGATGFMYGWSSGSAMIIFELCKRRVKFVLRLPDRNDPEFTRTPARGTTRSPQQAEAAWEQECRRKWRSLSLSIKAKLESVASEIAVFEDEFMAHIVLPNGATVGEFMGPQISVAYETGKMPALLPEK